MVQGGSQVYVSKTPCHDWDKSSRKSGFEAIQKKEQEKKQAQQQKDKYGAWGPVFKNKENFVNMHQF